MYVTPDFETQSEARADIAEVRADESATRADVSEARADESAARIGRAEQATRDLIKRGIYVIVVVCALCTLALYLNRHTAEKHANRNACAISTIVNRYIGPKVDAQTQASYKTLVSQLDPPLSECPKILSSK